MSKRIVITQVSNGLIIWAYTDTNILATSYIARNYSELIEVINQLDLFPVKGKTTLSSHAVVTALPSQKPEQELSLEKYIKIYHTTKTAKEIAALHNCSVDTVYRHARNLKLTLKKK